MHRFVTEMGTYVHISFTKWFIVWCIVGYVGWVHYLFIVNITIAENGIYDPV